MKGQPQRRLEEIFHRLAELVPAERAPLLEKLCAGDAAMRAEVEALLAAHDGANILDDRVELGGIAAGHTPLPADPLMQIGEMVGPYRILQLLGRGGMGAVYLAEQSLPVRRTVAMKIIQHGLASTEVLRRFELERQTLARLDSPYVARILDAGATADGRPYFTMEHVDGIPITRYADWRRLEVRERLQLFLQVCEGIRHAHQRGIVHRDIKPSNILVAEDDGEPTVKIIDFGVARVLEEDLAESGRTLSGVVLGTPEYMSPEQSDAAVPDVDIRSDVYAAGVLLFELLVGELPFTREEIRERKSRERSATPLPSARLTRLADGGAREAEFRGASPSHLQRQLRGELDWICLRALEADRKDRYQTIGALAEDIERYLADEAVVAGPHSSGYRFRKFARRHRALIAVSSTALLLLIAATAVSVTFSIREQAARRATESALLQVEKEQQRGQATLDFIRDQLGLMTTASEALPADMRKEMLERSILLVEADVDLDDRDRASVWKSLGAIFEDQRDFESALTLLNRAEAAFETTPDANAYEYADCLVTSARVRLVRFHDEAEALPRIYRAIEIAEESYPSDRFERAMIESMAGQLLSRSSDREGAKRRLRSLRESIRHTRVREPDREFLARARIGALDALFRVLNAEGEFVEADGVLRETNDVANESGLNDGKTRLKFFRSRALLSTRFHRWESAAVDYDSLHAIHTSLFGADNATTLYYAGLQAGCWAEAGNANRAREIVDAAVAACEADSARRFDMLPKLLVYRGDVARLSGRIAAAGEDYQRAKEGMRELFPAGQALWFGRIAHRQALVSAASGAFAVAEREYALARELLQEESGARSPEALDSAYGLASLLVQRGDFQRAEPIAIENYDDRALVLGPDSAPARESARLVEQMYEAWSRPDELRAWQTRIASASPGNRDGDSTNQ